MTRFTWGWSADGRRQLLAIPPGVPIDPPLAPGEVEIDVSDLGETPLAARIEAVALAAMEHRQ